MHYKFDAFCLYSRKPLPIMIDRFFINPFINQSKNCWERTSFLLKKIDAIRVGKSEGASLTPLETVSRFVTVIQTYRRGQ